jgi:hypothetical protein
VPLMPTLVQQSLGIGTPTAPAQAGYMQ